MKNIVIVTLAIALVPCWALAQNGVVQINQSTVTATGSNRATGGFPYTITQPGSYELTGNLTVPAGVNGIVITASQVTLDLNGFSITTGPCAGGCQAYGISDFGSTIPAVFGTTVRNGSVAGFGFGIDLAFSGASLIEKVTALNNSNDGIFAAFGSVVRDCIAIANGGNGIRVADGILTGNLAKFNFFNGFKGMSASVAFTGNSATNNTQAGFAVACPSNLIGNMAVLNGTPESESGTGCNKANNLGF